MPGTDPIDPCLSFWFHCCESEWECKSTVASSDMATDIKIVGKESKAFMVAIIMTIIVQSVCLVVAV